jgi:hypothetical protein
MRQGEIKEIRFTFLLERATEKMCVHTHIYIYIYIYIEHQGTKNSDL